MPGRTAARQLDVARLAVLAFIAAVVAVAALSTDADADASEPAALEVSFDPSAAVRLRGQRLVARPGADIAIVNEVIGRYPGARVESVFKRSAAALDELRTRLRGRGHLNAPDLGRHFRIAVPRVAERDDLVLGLRRLEIVDDVVAEPEPAPPPSTPDLSPFQGYTGAAPAGIAAGAFAGMPGGRGEHVKIVDVEYAWNRAHEDLVAKVGDASTLILNGTPKDPFPEEEAIHGTAVIGELAGGANGFGVTGLAPGSEIGMVNAATAGDCARACWALANAINVAHANMAAGDVMLIEQQAQGLGADRDYVPVEILSSVYDAILAATQDGIIVVEAAGNADGTGMGVDLDAAVYGTPFPQGKPDSGAMIVGAASGGCHGSLGTRMSYSAFGSRVNLQGWGECVATTVTSGRYGLLFDGGTATTRYTRDFAGTSSAAPMVAAAAALYSSVHQAVRGAAPTPQAVRSRLVATGTPQAFGASGHIGPLPNLAALAGDFDTTPPTVTSTVPAAGATSVPVTTAVDVTFSEPMDQASVEAAFNLLRTGDITRPPGTFSWAGQTMTFRPATALAGGQQYLAEIGSGARDRAGNRVPAATMWAFVTASAPATPPSIVARAPAANATGVPVSTNVTASFSEPVQGVTTQTFTLIDSRNGALVAAAVRQGGTASQWTLDPTGDLRPDTRYTVRLYGGPSSIRDASGDPLATTGWSFTTAKRKR